MDEKLIIDRHTFKALAVDTRLNILKIIAKKSRTLTELATILNLQNSTVKEHLDVLLAAGLIKKEDTSRKWKYYFITPKGLRIIQPREVKVFFAFIVTLLSAIVSGYLLFSNYLFIPKANETLREGAVLMRASTANHNIHASEILGGITNQSSPLILFILFVTLVALSGFLLGLFTKKPLLSNFIKKNKDNPK